VKAKKEALFPFKLHENLVVIEKRGLGSPNITPVEFFFPPYHKKKYEKKKKKRGHG
jgi:hypothetical protein